MTYQAPRQGVVDRQAKALVWLLISLPFAGLIHGYSPLIVRILLKFLRFVEHEQAHDSLNDCLVSDLLFGVFDFQTFFQSPSHSLLVST
jgi:hypothetical protein